MNKVATNKKIIAMSNKVAKAIELEMEEILDHAEQVIKQYVPARYVKASLIKLETLLSSEGIQVNFDKEITRESFRKTAKIQVTAKEINEVLKAVASAVVAEAEEVLEDADEVVTGSIKNVRLSSKFEIESKLKNIIEKKSFNNGINFKLSRTAKRKTKN